MTVTILDAAGDTVATLVRDRPVPRYKQFSLRWNGRRGAPRGYTVVTAPDGTTIVTPVNTGALAPAGEYRVHVALRAAAPHGAGAARVHAGETMSAIPAPQRARRGSPRCPAPA